MIKKKICLLGSFGVGKTSLIKRFVLNIFSDTYITTIGVKVEKKAIMLDDGQEVLLVIWDLEGSDEFDHLAETYLRGMSGYILVADGTREETLDTALKIKKCIDRKSPELPVTLILNKMDLAEEWIIRDETIKKLEQIGLPVLKASAKTGEEVEHAFIDIGARMTTGNA